MLVGIEKVFADLDWPVCCRHALAVADQCLSNDSDMARRPHFYSLRCWLKVTWPSNTALSSFDPKGLVQAMTNHAGGRRLFTPLNNMKPPNHHFQRNLLVRDPFVELVFYESLKGRKIFVQVLSSSPIFVQHEHTTVMKVS